MEDFIRLTITPYLVIAGILTMTPLLFALAPGKAVPRMLKLPWDEKYTILVRHWGFLVTLVGISLIIAIFVKPLLFPVMIFSTVQKLFMVILFFCYLKKPWAAGFRTIGVADSLMVLYSLLYFAALAIKGSINLY
jgi:hypothetical protein